MMIRKLCFACAAFCAVSVFSTAAFAAQGAPDSSAQKECSPRGGLPNFYKKIAEGGDVKIAYFGGSITAQSGWRVQSLEYLKKKYPSAKFSEINAAIGGTGSFLGAFRLKRDVLDKKPDLVFVEFAVNDAGSSPAQVINGMEGIVRQIIKSDPHTDICFVYTTTWSLVENAQKGRPNAAQLAMEKVADRYGIPSIDMGLDVARLAKEGKLVMKTDAAPMAQVAGSTLDGESPSALDKDGKIPFAKDGVHPYPNTGHVVYTNSLKRGFAQIEKLGARNVSHMLPRPLDPLCLENVSAVSIAELPHTGGREVSVDSGVASCFKGKCLNAWIFSPGDEIDFKFKGTTAALYNALGYACGSIEISVDGRKPVKKLLIDAYGAGMRVGIITLVANAPDKVHTVKIRVLDENIDKREILFPKNRAFYDAHKKLYETRYLILGCAFIAGEIVK